jgi:hypothetical protein
MSPLKQRFISMIGLAAFAATVAAQPIAVTAAGDPNLDVGED